MTTTHTASKHEPDFLLPEGVDADPGFSIAMKVGIGAILMAVVLAILWLTTDDVECQELVLDSAPTSEPGSVLGVVPEALGTSDEALDDLSTAVSDAITHASPDLVRVSLVAGNQVHPLGTCLSSTIQVAGPNIDMPRERAAEIIGTEVAEQVALLELTEPLETNPLLALEVADAMDLDSVVVLSGWFATTGCLAAVGPPHPVVDACQELDRTGEVDGLPSLRADDLSLELLTTVATRPGQLAQAEAMRDALCAVYPGCVRAAASEDAITEGGTP